MKTTTIIWDFDGTLLPPTPSDSEQTMVLYKLMALSCGTADLSQRTLIYAGLGECFESIAGNRFKISHGLINGMKLHVPNPVDKVKWIERKGISADEAIAVGDGYTDIPLLDWAKIGVLVGSNRSEKS